MVFRPVRFRTICAVIRELFLEAEERKDHLAMTKLEEAHDMAKRMHRKLVNYNKKEVYSSVDGGGDANIQLHKPEMRDIVAALELAQKQTPVGDIKVRWDALIDYFNKHTAY